MMEKQNKNVQDNTETSILNLKHPKNSQIFKVQVYNKSSFEQESMKELQMEL